METFLCRGTDFPLRMFLLDFLPEYHIRRVGHHDSPDFYSISSGIGRTVVYGLLEGLPAYGSRISAARLSRPLAGVLQPGNDTSAAGRSGIGSDSAGLSGHAGEEQ